MPEVQLVYFHDPMCSWCWGYKPTWARLKNKLPKGLSLIAVVGGLAPDTDKPMPQAMRSQLEATWQRIEIELDTSFNYDFWRYGQPRRSTYMACRAVLAAGLQGRGDDMVEAIQRAYYLRALNPSDKSVLMGLAGEIALDGALFSEDIVSSAVQRQLEQQIKLARTWPVNGFPSLVLKQGERLTPVRLDYHHESQTLNHIHSLLS